MAWSNAYVKLGNRMNKSACTIALGTAVQALQSACAIIAGNIAASGSYVVVLADQSASVVNFTNAAGTKGFMFQQFRSSSPVIFSANAGLKYVYNNTSGCLNLYPYGNSGSLIVGDVIMYQLF
jgi:hypothetical protein